VAEDRRWRVLESLRGLSLDDLVTSVS
jgi:hypothetical protein